jgi:hypothetical protein
LRFGIMMVMFVVVGAILLKPARHHASLLNCLF